METEVKKDTIPSLIDELNTLGIYWHSKRIQDIAKRFQKAWRCTIEQSQHK